MRTLLSMMLCVVWALGGCGSQAGNEGHTPADAAASAIVAVTTDTLTSAECLITENSIAGVRNGMDMAQIRQLWPEVSTSRILDPEGAVWVELNLGGVMLSMFTDNMLDVSSLPELSDEEKAQNEDFDEESIFDGPLDENQALTLLQTFDPKCHTKAHVHPQMKVVDASKIYGPVVAHEQSEIEAREYVTFRDQPAGMTFRIDYAQSDEANELMSTDPVPYRLDATILGIGVE